MEPITTKEKLKEHIYNLVSVETLARDEYEKESKLFNDIKLKTVLNRIKQDENRHIAILNKLIEMLESN